MTELSSALRPAYELGPELTPGGMARVFRARDVALGRDVVVKVLDPSLGASVSAERFAREVLLAAQLQQANIVPVLAAGDASGTPYYVMPYVEGQSLRARMQRGPVAPMEAFDLLRDVARALAFAHGRGIVHRDIKPENILLSGASAVVTDFGIAKAVADARTAGDGAAGLTAAGTSLGTPGYMAPEQALGDVADARADVYAWGVTAYELLAGRHPFADATTAQQLVAAHVSQPPPPLPAHVPRAWADLVAACLAKAPAARPANGEALLTALAGTGHLATPSRHGGRWAVAAAAMISVVGLGAVWRYTHAPEAPVPSVVVLPFDNVGDASDAYLAAGLTDEIAGTLARIPGVQVLGRASTSVERTDRLTPREVARSLGARWVLTGSVRWSRASGGATPRVRIAPALVEVETGAQTCCDPVEDAPDDVFKVQAEVATRVAQGLSLQLTAGDRAALAATDTRDAEARDAQRSGRYLLRLRGLPNVVAAEREFARAVGRDSQYARAWAGLAEAALLRYSSYDLTRSRQSLHEDARRASERAVALAPTDPVVLVARARVLSDADLRLVPALALVDSALGTDPSDVSAWLLRTELLLGLGRVEEAAQAVTRARVLDNLAGLVWMETMYVHFAKAQFDSAVTAAERAVTLGAGNLIYARSLVLALALAGRTDEASAMCKSAMESEAACRAFVGALGSRTPERFLAAAGAAEQRARSFGDRRAEPTASAIAYARLGRLDTALERLEFAAATRDPSLILLLQHPAFTPLRSTPRYRALMDTLQRP